MTNTEESLRAEILRLQLETARLANANAQSQVNRGGCLDLILLVFAMLFLLFLLATCAA